METPRKALKPPVKGPKKPSAVPKGKRLHVIGGAGVAMAPLAVLYKEMGWEVTVSDRAFFPPMSTYLEKNGIHIMPGFKVEHLKPHPDMVLANAFITKQNPELKYAIEHSIPYKTYAEVLPELIEGVNSVVVAGSRGKTSTTALATWVLECGGLNPSFMIGGIAKNFPDGIRKTNSDWTVMEGDEYPVASWKKTPKFLEYNPRYLILTGVTWDHMDIYPTEKSYLDIFKKLVLQLPENGAIIANKQGDHVAEILKETSAPVIWYNAKEPFPFTPPFKGRGWRENSMAVATLAKLAKIPAKTIQSAFNNFEGVKRRQEVRYQKGNLVVIDDNAHSPEKVEGVIDTLQEQYPGYRIVAVYEPGSRNTKALLQKSYATCFEGTEYILLPRVSAAAKEVANFNERLHQTYATHYSAMEYIPDDRELISRKEEISAEWRRSQQKGIIAFMSQKGFRGMIEEAINHVSRIM